MDYKHKKLRTDKYTPIMNLIAEIKFEKSSQNILQWSSPVLSIFFSLSASYFPTSDPST